MAPIVREEGLISVGLSSSLHLDIIILMFFFSHSLFSQNWSAEYSDVILLTAGRDLFFFFFLSLCSRLCGCANYPLESEEREQTRERERKEKGGVR